MPVFANNLLHIKLYSVLIDYLTFQEFAFRHDSFWLLLFLIDDDNNNYEKSRKQQNKLNSIHTN